MHWLRAAAAASTVVLAVTVSACGNGDPNATPSGGAADAAAIHIGKDVTGTPKAKVAAASGGSSYVWNPTTVNAKAGDVIEFDNPTDAAHNVTFDAGPKSDNFASGANVLVKIDKAGTYKLQCTLHPGMVSEVDVT